MFYKLKSLGGIMDNRPIGIFDSGIGGLTVLKEISSLLPNENIIYFGDCGRAPYGTKSRETIVRYDLQNTEFLLEQNIKIIVVACNTASAYGIDEIRAKAGDVPVLDVISPGAKFASVMTQNNKVGVIGTNATINSGVYEKSINRENENIKVFSKACPLFAPIVEEGWWDSEVAVITAQTYLKCMSDNGIDTILLGCTHYPLLEGTINKVLGDSVCIINSAREVARAVKERLLEDGIENVNIIQANYQFFTSDSVDKFKELGELFLNKEMECVCKADIELYSNKI